MKKNYEKNKFFSLNFCEIFVNKKEKLTLRNNFVKK